MVKCYFCKIEIEEDKAYFKECGKSIKLCCLKCVDKSKKEIINHGLCFDCIIKNKNLKTIEKIKEEIIFKGLKNGK